MMFLSDAQGIKEIRNYCDDFGKTIDLIDKEKNKQYQHMQTAIKVLKRFQFDSEQSQSPTLSQRRYKRQPSIGIS